MRKIAKIKGLDCAHCAAKLEKALNKVEGVLSAQINFMAERITLELDDVKAAEVILEIKKVTKKLHPEVEYMGI